MMSRKDVITYVATVIAVIAVVLVTWMPFEHDRKTRTFIEAQALDEVVRRGVPRDKLRVLTSQREEKSWWVYFGWDSPYFGSHCSVDVADDGTILAFHGGK